MLNHKLMPRELVKSMFGFHFAAKIIITSCTVTYYSNQKHSEMTISVLIVQVVHKMAALALNVNDLV